MAFKKCWIFNSTSTTGSGPQMKPFNSLWSRCLGKKNTVPDYSSQKAESKQHIKRDSNKKEGKKTERRVNRNSPDYLSDSHRPTLGCPPYSLHAQRSVLATVDREIPFGFRRRAVRKVITALLPASLLQFQMESFAQNMEKYWETM